MGDLDTARAQIESLREHIEKFVEMQLEVHSSPTRVHAHVCEHVEHATRSLVDIVDTIDAVMAVRKAQVVENRAKINEIVAYIENADALKLKLGPVPAPLGDI